MKITNTSILTYKTSLFFAKFDIMAGGPIWIKDRSTGEIATLEAAYAGDLGVSDQIADELDEIDTYFYEMS